MNNAFERLLAPITAEAFFNSYWGQEFLYIRRDPDYEWLIDMSDVDSLVQVPLSAGQVEVLRGGDSVPLQEWSRPPCSRSDDQRVTVPERLVSFYRQGCTLVLNGVHRTLPRLENACRQIASVLAFPVQANMYITPPDSRGSRRHVDSHEVMILQIQGSKAWRLFPDETEEAPLTNVTAGELLYIPRGLPHEGVAGHQGSVHIALGLKPMYADDLLLQVADAILSRPQFRRPLLPKHSATGIDCLMSALLDRSLLTEALDQRAAESLRDFEQGRPIRLSNLLVLDQLNLASRVKGSGVVPRILNRGNRLRIEYGQKSIVLPYVLKESAIPLLSGDPLQVCEIPGLISDEGKIEIAKEFILAGLTVILEP